jgi:hypothetical protein
LVIEALILDGLDEEGIDASVIHFIALVILVVRQPTFFLLLVGVIPSLILFLGSPIGFITVLANFVKSDCRLADDLAGETTVFFVFGGIGGAILDVHPKESSGVLNLLVIEGLAVGEQFVDDKGLEKRVLVSVLRKFFDFFHVEQYNRP